MTRAKIITMEPCRELDAIVAEKVMEWKDCHLSSHGEMHEWVGKDPAGGLFGGIKFIPRYSDDFSSAWLVVNKIKELTFYHEQQHPTREPWIRFCNELVGHGCDEDGFNLSFWWVSPERICKAAFLAVMDQSELTETGIKKAIEEMKEDQ